MGFYASTIGFASGCYECATSHWSSSSNEIKKLAILLLLVSAARSWWITLKLALPLRCIVLVFDKATRAGPLADLEGFEQGILVIRA